MKYECHKCGELVEDNMVYSDDKVYHVACYGEIVTQKDVEEIEQLLKPIFEKIDDLSTREEKEEEGAQERPHTANIAREMAARILSHAEVDGLGGCSLCQQ